MSLIPLNSSLTAQNIADNLGVEDYNQVNDIKVIVEGFHAEAQQVNANVEQSLRNMYLQTASESYLDLAGMQEGIYRIKEPSLTLKAEERVVYILVEEDDHYSESFNASTESFSKGSKITIPSLDLELTFLQDLPLRDIKINTKRYISCNVKSIISNTLEYISGSQVSFDSLPAELSNILRRIKIGFDRDVKINVVEETVDNYRDRIIYSKSIPKYGTSTAITLALSSNPLISQYYIDQTVYPFNICIFNTSMLYDTSITETLEEFAVTQISSTIDDRKSDGTDYTVSTAKAVEFSLEVYDGSGEKIEFNLLDFRSFIASQFLVGNVYNIDIESINNFLSFQGLTEQAEDIKFYKYKEGYSYVSRDSSITIERDEYPAVRVEI